MNLIVFVKNDHNSYDYVGRFPGSHIDTILATTAVARKLGVGIHTVFAAWDEQYGKLFEVTVPTSAAMVREL